MIFTCQYVFEGYIEKQFYREGDTAKKVREEIDTFLWADLTPGGEWIITESLEIPELR